MNKSPRLSTIEVKECVRIEIKVRPGDTDNFDTQGLHDSIMACLPDTNDFFVDYDDDGGWISVNLFGANAATYRKRVWTAIRAAADNETTVLHEASKSEYTAGGEDAPFGAPGCDNGEIREAIMSFHH